MPGPAENEIGAPLGPEISCKSKECHAFNSTLHILMTWAVVPGRLNNGQPEGSVDVASNTRTSKLKQAANMPVKWIATQPLGIRFIGATTIFKSQGALNKQRLG